MVTPGVLPLACGFLTPTPLASASQAIANALRDRLQETISVGALDPADPGRIIYIARAERNQVIAAPLMVGSTPPSHCTSMGRILLSALSADLREEWLSHTVLEHRTERKSVSADALSAELELVAENKWSLETGRAPGRERVGE